MNNDQNNDLNREETEEDGIRLGTLRRLQALHRSKAFVAQSRAASPPPPLSTGQWLDDRLTSMQEEQDEYVQSGAMDGGWAWAKRRKAERLGKKETS
jgi:hypothetical protein